MQLRLWVVSVLLAQCLSAADSSSSTSIAQNLALYCKNVDISAIMALSLNRTKSNEISFKIFQSFSNGTMNFLTSPNKGSSFLGVLPPLLLPIIFMLGFLVSLAFMIGIFFPHFCKARKEEVTLSKQRVFFYFTIFFILILTFCFVMLWYYILQTITQVNETACLYYKAQYELTVGYTAAPYQFMGFDNFNDAVAIFQQELVDFVSLAPFFQNLNSMNFLSFTSSMLPAVQNYSASFDGQQIANVDGTLQRPILIQSLTTAISDDVKAEISTIVGVCQSLASIATYGIQTINTYGQQINLLIQSLTSTITVVVTQFQTVISVLQPYDSSVATLVSLMDNTKIILAVLLVLTFAFVPYFLSFYHFKNSSDNHDWMVYPAKVVNLLLSILGIVLTVLFFFVLAITVIVSSSCFYIDGLLTNTETFNKNFIQDLHISDANINATMRYCFNQTTSNFVTFLSVTDNGSDGSGATSTTPVRKIPAKITRATGPPNTTTNASNTTTTDVSVGADVARRLLARLGGDPALAKKEAQEMVDHWRRLQSTTTTTTTTTTTNSTNSTNSTNGTNYTISTNIIPNPPPGFNLTALLNFQSFVTSLNTYDAFYNNATSSESPSIQEFLGQVASMSNGQLNNFVEYEFALNTLTDAVSCNSSAVVLNGQACGSAVLYCNVIIEQTVFDFSQRIAAAPCVVNPSQVINLYNSLRISWQSGVPLYTNMSGSLFNASQANSTLPGNLMVSARAAILSASQVVAGIEAYISSTMAWFNQFNGDLTGISSCYIARKELSDFEPALCFQLQSSLTYVTLFLLGIVLSILVIQWGIFYSIKYSGNLTIASWVSATTQGSGWDKSRMTAVSFMQQSEIVPNEKSEIQDSDDEKSYFEKDGKGEEDALSDEASDDD